MRNRQQACSTLGSSGALASNCALCVRVCAAGFGRGGLLVGGVLGGATYAMMSGEGMDAIKSTLPLDKL